MLELLLQISDAGFNVGLLCAAFFAPRDDGIERLSHTTEIARRLCTCLLALQPPWQAHVIPKEKSPKATHCAVELVPLVGVRHRRQPLAVVVAELAHVPLITGDDPELASYLRIEERELEAGGLN
jgi:hypothetical protein